MAQKENDIRDTFSTGLLKAIGGFGWSAALYRMK
jgi:hypothetical protein